MVEGCYPLKQLNGEMEDELAFHIESYANDLIRGGIPHEEAFRARAHRTGWVTTQKENMPRRMGNKCVGRTSRRIFPMPSACWQKSWLRGDCNWILALGIGANTVIFTVTKAILLDKLERSTSRRVAVIRYDARR